VPIIVARPS